MMSPSAWISKISLHNFKNHLSTNISDLSSFIVLNGKNGSGKTNILEAISLFAPGKGMRSSSLSEILNKQKNEASEIKINLQYEAGEIEIKRFFSNIDKKYNFISVDEHKIKNIELLDFINILWITPVMEKVMIQSNSEKRNFFDRLIFNLDKNHLKNYSKLQKLLNERLILLSQKDFNKNWIDIIENNIVLISEKIITNRLNFINELNQKLKLVKKPFNSCSINIHHELLHLDKKEDFAGFVKHYKSTLETNRKVDSELRKTTKTINKVKIEIFNSPERLIEAKQCSTGEQKSILLSIFISVANMLKEKKNGRTPIILIDEAMAHLDVDHKKYLFEELTKLKTQVWFSGVSKDLFKDINDQTVFFEMKNII